MIVWVVWGVRKVISVSYSVIVWVVWNVRKEGTNVFCVDQLLYYISMKFRLPHPFLNLLASKCVSRQFVSTLKLRFLKVNINMQIICNCFSSVFISREYFLF